MNIDVIYYKLLILFICFVLLVYYKLVFKESFLNKSGVKNVNKLDYNNFEDESEEDESEEEFEEKVKFSENDDFINCKEKLYRLGDIIKGDNFRRSLGDYHKKCFPDSIAVEYMRRTEYSYDYKVLEDIIDGIPLLPSKKTLIIHLRCGDVLEKSPYSVSEHLNSELRYKNGIYYVKPRSYYNRILQNIKKYDIKNVEIITGFHNSKKYPKSIVYINAIKNMFDFKYKTRVISGRSPDYDFAYMSHSKYFVKSGGGFSRLIAKMVERNNGICL